MIFRRRGQGIKLPDITELIADIFKPTDAGHQLAAAYRRVSDRAVVFFNQTDAVAVFVFEIQTFEKLGLHFLNNDGYRVSRNGDSLYLAGVTDAVAPLYGLPGPDPTKALRSSRPGDTVILLDHRPENARVAAEKGIALQLSGHTHGGMIAGLDSLIGPANNGFVSGLYKVGSMSLYVSNGSGIWNGFPFRLGKPSEITLITLHSETSNMIVE